MRYLIFPAFLLCAMAPIHSVHNEPRKVDEEFTQLYKQAQPEQFRVVSSTPLLSELKDSEVVIFSSGEIGRAHV